MFILQSKRRAIVMAGALVIAGLGAVAPTASASAPTVGRTMLVEPDQVPSLPASIAPKIPAVNATSDPLSIAAGEALWALWFDDPLYLEKIAAVVPVTAARAGVSASALMNVWLGTEKRRMIVVLSALTQVGVPYKHYAMAPGKGFDCSGLTTWAWLQAGVALPKQSYRQIKLVTPKPLDAVLPGDLLYYPGHISIAIGVSGSIVHAPYTGRTVEVRPMMKYRAPYLRAGSPI